VCTTRWTTNRQVLPDWLVSHAIKNYAKKQWKNQRIKALLVAFRWTTNRKVLSSWLASHVIELHPKELMSIENSIDSFLLIKIMCLRMRTKTGNVGWNSIDSFRSFLLQKTIKNERLPFFVRLLVAYRHQTAPKGVCQGYQSTLDCTLKVLWGRLGRWGRFCCPWSLSSIWSHDLHSQNSNFISNPPYSELWQRSLGYHYRKKEIGGVVAKICVFSSLSPIECLNEVPGPISRSNFNRLNRFKLFGSIYKRNTWITLIT